jgi:hypothetical protein
MNDISLRDTIKAAMEGEASAPAAAPEAPPAPEGEASSTPPSPEISAEPEAAGPARGADGKFAPKAEPAAAITEQAALPPNAEPPPQEETIRVPAALPAPLKAKFKELPPEWRDALTKREDDVNAMRDQWAPKAERLNRYEAVVAPHKNHIALAGVDEATYIGRLFAAEQVLRTDGVEGVVQLMDMYGIHPQALVQRITGGQGASQGMTSAQMDPNVQRLLGEVQTLKSTIEQQQQTAEQQATAAIEAEIAQFANDPENLYFENVRGDVAAILRAGGATTLKDAYDKAVWANPETRGLLMQEQAAKAAQPSPEAAARARAEAAARAAGSVTGAPAAGAVMGADPTNLRDTIRAAISSQGGRV